MSLSLVRASSQYGYFNLGSQPSLPLILGCKIKFTTVNVTQRFLGVVAATGDWNGWMAGSSSDSTTIRAEVINTPNYDTSSLTGNSSGAWHTLIAEFRSATDRQVYFNASSGNLNASNITPVGAARLVIGANFSGGVAADFANALIAEVFQLNAAPTSTERTSYQNGSKPNDIWTTSLVRYWPLKDDVVDDVLGNTLTLVNSPTINADHPTMIDLSGGAVIRRRREYS